MSPLFGSCQPGDHVKARRDITAGFLDAITGSATVPQGRRGIVREVRPGLFTDRYVVEFDDGWTTQTLRDIRSSDVRKAALGHGERSWGWRRDVSVGVRLGIFLAIGLPTLIALGTYFLNGGTVGELFGALVTEALLLAGDIIAFIGPTVSIVVVACALLLLARMK